MLSQPRYSPWRRQHRRGLLPVTPASVFVLVQARIETSEGLRRMGTRTRAHQTDFVTAHRGSRQSMLLLTPQMDEC